MSVLKDDRIGQCCLGCEQSDHLQIKALRIDLQQMKMIQMILFDQSGRRDDRNGFCCDAVGFSSRNIHAFCQRFILHIAGSKCLQNDLFVETGQSGGPAAWLKAILYKRCFPVLFADSSPERSDLPVL